MGFSTVGCSQEGTRARRILTALVEQPPADAAVDGTAIRLTALRELGETLEAERDRWALWLPVLFGVGIGLYFALPREPALLAALMPLAVALTPAAMARSGLAAVVIGGAAIAVSGGFAAAKIRADLVAAPVLHRDLRNVEVTGYVEQIEPRPGRGQRLTLQVLSLAGLGPTERPWRVRVRTMTAIDGLRPGDAVRVKATLARPSPPFIPGGHDFARAAWFQRLGAIGYATSRPVIVTDVPTAPLALRLFASVQQVRQIIADRIAATLGGEPGALVTALITGERGGLSEATTEAFRASGLVHMLSISGLHMVIMAGAAYVLIRLVLAAIPALALRFPIQKWAAAGASLAALAYLLISGAAPATARSYVMITIGFLAVLLDRPAIAMRTVAISALVLLVAQPEIVLDIGFQMSFAAVVALVAAYEALRASMQRNDRERRRGAVLRVLLFFGGIVLSTLVAGVAVAPFSAYHFHQSQQYALVANLIALPICNIVVMPAALLALLMMPFGLEVLPLTVMGWGAQAMIWCAYAVASLPGAVVPLPAIPATAFLSMVAGGLWLCLWRRRWRFFGLALVAAGLGLAPFEKRFHALIGQDGHLVAVRGPDGRLAVSQARGGSYEVKRWLAHDGDGRTPAAAAAGTAFRCDGVGCVTTVQNVTIALARRAPALVDDCAAADVVVLAWPKPRGCRPRVGIIDLYAIRDHGVHALRIENGRVAITTVESFRGIRPWTLAGTTVAAHAGNTNGRTRAVSDRSRISRFAPSRLLTDGDLPPRPEIEDDEAVSLPERDLDQ